MKQNLFIYRCVHLEKRMLKKKKSNFKHNPPFYVLYTFPLYLYHMIAAQVFAKVFRETSHKY